MDHRTDGQTEDDFVTVASIGLLAYASADVAHHVLGHGGACLALGGHIRSLSSIFVDCTVLRFSFGLAGPAANLAVGLIALAAARWARSASSASRLFLALAAGFNLLWFFLQLLFSAATRTDDYSWAMRALHADAAVQYGLIAIGALGYLFTIYIVAKPIAGFADLRERPRRIVLIAWTTGGTFACATALFGHNPLTAILRHAAPQSFGLSVGLLFVPRFAIPPPSVAGQPPIGKSVPWILAACVVAALSIVLLGPGIAIP